MVGAAMNIFTRTFVVVAAACLLAAIFAPALAVDAVDRPLDVGDALKLTNHESLAELAVVKMHGLADLLAGVTDESTARDRAPAAERYCLELQLLQARTRMVAPVASSDPHAVHAHSRRCAEAKGALDAELDRINSAPPLAQHLQALKALLRPTSDVYQADLPPPAVEPPNLTTLPRRPPPPASARSR